MTPYMGDWLLIFVTSPWALSFVDPIIEIRRFDSPIVCEFQAKSLALDHKWERPRSVCFEVAKIK